MAVVTGHPRPDASIINFTREPFRSPADIALAGFSFFGHGLHNLYRSSAVWQGKSCNFGRKTERFRAVLDLNA